ncbi:hypothetical protein [Pseudomonas sp. UM16]|uniref:hypothetical protein n=1 Tax=Pseudomonas sp. UM16 TaxID=3158962 RepID=UPI00399000A3
MDFNLQGIPMPTENRSSNTEQMVSELLPCPFCGQKLELSNRKYNHWARCATDGCKGGQLPLLNTELAADIVSWNTRAQHQGDPVAVMYADGMMLTKADCGPAFETVCKVEIPLYLHPPTSDGFSAGDMADQGAKAFRDGQRSIAELTDDLREILGRPNFTCHYIAQALRQMGRTIAKKSEDEQATVIHWMLGHYLKYGADWRQHASDELKAASQNAE